MKGVVASSRRRGPNDPAFRPQHLFSWGGYRLENMAFTPPIALDFWNTIDNGDGTHTATPSTLGGVAHGLIPGRPFVLRRNNGGVLTPIAYSVPSTTTISVTFDAARTGESGTVESENPRVATYTNPGAWGGIITKSTLASRPELWDALGTGRLSLRGGNGLQFRAGPFDPAPVVAAGGMTIVVVVEPAYNKILTNSDLWSVSNVGKTTYFKSNVGGGPFRITFATKSSVASVASGTSAYGEGLGDPALVSDPYVLQVYDEDIGGATHRANLILTVDLGQWGPGTVLGTAVSGSQEWDGGDLYVDLLGGFQSSNYGGLNVLSFDVLAGVVPNDPALFTWLAEVQPGPTYPS